MTVDKARIKVAEGNTREAVEQFALLIDTFSDMAKNLFPLKNEEITPKAEELSQLCDYLLSACVYFDLPQPANWEEVEKVLSSIPDKMWAIRKLLTKYNLFPIRRGRTGYEKMLNGPGLNNGLRASKRRMKRSEKITSAGLEIVGEQIIEGVHVELSNFDALNITAGARKLFDILTIKLTKQVPYKPTAEQILKERRVTLSLDEYMSLCGLSDRKESQKQLRNNTEVLYHISLEWDERSKIIDPETGRKKYRKRHWKARLLDGTGEDEAITGSGITVYFLPELVEYLGQGFIMQSNLRALTINTNKYRHAYNLYRKLYEYYNENRPKHEHIRISVQSLLKACPEMPRPEEVKSRHYKQQIIDPFEDNMDALQEAGIIVSWEYCNSGGEPLTDEQLTAYHTAIDFKDWVQWLVEKAQTSQAQEGHQAESYSFACKI